jgi:hypothetical protein
LTNYMAEAKKMRWQMAKKRWQGPIGYIEVCDWKCGSICGQQCARVH